MYFYNVYIEHMFEDEMVKEYLEKTKTTRMRITRH